MKKLRVILAYTFLFINLGYGQNVQKNDSLKRLLKTISPDSLRLKANVYGDLIWNYATTRIQLDSARMYTDSLHEFSNNVDYERGIARSHFYYGVINRFEGNHSEGLEHLETFVKYFREHQDSAKVSSGLYQIATIQSYIGNYSESLAKHYELLNIYKLRKDKNSIANQLNSIGHLLRKVAKTREAITSYEDAIKIHLETNANKIGLSMTYESLGNTYSELKEFEKAEKYYLESLSIEKEENNIDGIASVTENLGNLFYGKDDFEKALIYHTEALNTRKNLPSKRNLAISLTKVGKTYLQLDQHKKAEEYLLKSLAIAEKIDLKPSLIENYINLIKIHQKGNTFKEGFKYQSLLMTVKDSVLNKDKTKQILELNTKYETEKKEREIVEQTLTIEKNERQKNQILFGLGALGILLIGLFIFFKKRMKYQKTIAFQNEMLQKQKITELQQNNKLLALNSMIEGQEAERLRIAKDLHDSLGGLLSTVKNHFATIQKEIEQIEKLDLTKKTNSLIDEACIEVRRISHNMMPHALSISGLKGAIEDLGEQLNEQGYLTTIEISSALKNIDETKKVTIYRLVQEIISNIRKHAKAKTILIQLLTHQNEINLIIEDDGIGFNYEEAIKKSGMGLESIISRIQFLDGKINWDSEINKGSTVSINIPI